jgi:hypothetical protein
MRTRIGLVIVAALATLCAAEQPAHASHHLWRFKQAYSNVSGTVQFVELFTTDNGETNVGTQSVTGNGGSFPFANNVTDPTAGTFLLIATSGFQSLTGVQPDLVVPAGFLSTGGGTVGYAGVDTWVYGALPMDGTHMLLRTGEKTQAVATNFAGTSAVLGVQGTPALPPWAIAASTGLLLFLASGLLRKQRSHDLAA